MHCRGDFRWDREDPIVFWEVWLMPVSWSNSVDHRKSVGAKFTAQAIWTTIILSFFLHSVLLSIGAVTCVSKQSSLIYFDRLIVYHKPIGKSTLRLDLLAQGRVWQINSPSM